MRDAFRKALACPGCHGLLTDGERELRCAACGMGFPVDQGIPLLLMEPARMPSAGRKVNVEQAAWIKTVKTVLTVPSPTLENRHLKEQMPKFLASFGPEACLANVGSASLGYGDRVANVDIFPDPGVDIVGDATRLPFADNSLDGFISRRVLEHVRKPGLAVAEMHRVLRPGGRVWCEIPFMQGYHPTPTDYQRYTVDGLPDLFDQFRVVEVGVALGPSSTLTWILREYLSILFSFGNPYLYKINERLFSWLTFPLKYLDLITARSPFAAQIASSFYIVAEKPLPDGGKN